MEKLREVKKYQGIRLDEAWKGGNIYNLTIFIFTPFWVGAGIFFFFLFRGGGGTKLTPLPDPCRILQQKAPAELFSFCTEDICIDDVMTSRPSCH